MNYFYETSPPSLLNILFMAVHILNLASGAITDLSVLFTGDTIRSRAHQVSIAFRPRYFVNS